MSFAPQVKAAIEEYVGAHLPQDSWYHRFFDFVNDAALADRLAEEFKAARTVYKFFRGLDAIGWQQRAQVRIQVLQYASIYEAVIHHVLFGRLGSTSEVCKLVEFPRLVPISIPAAAQRELERALHHDGKIIIPTYQGIGRNDESKVRFDDKVKCAVTLDLIQSWLAEELVRIYEARNAIHLHAEIRKNQRYEIELARTAYRRFEPFRDQLVASLRKKALLLGEAGDHIRLDDEPS